MIGLFFVQRFKVKGSKWTDGSRTVNFLWQHVKSFLIQGWKMLVIHPSAADDATQRQSACFIFNLTTSRGRPAPTFGVWRKGMPAKQSRRLAHFKTCSQDNCLSVNSYWSQDKNQSGRNYMAMTMIPVHAWPTAQNKGAKFRQLVHGSTATDVLSHSTFLFPTSSQEMWSLPQYFWNNSASSSLAAWKIWDTQSQKTERTHTHGWVLCHVTVTPHTFGGNVS